MFAAHDPWHPNSGLCAGGPAARGRRASAHPHVWVTMKSAVVYGPDGAIPASAMPGPSTTCIRPSPFRGWRARRRASSPREELAAARPGQRRVAEGVRLLHLRQGNGKKVTSRPGRYRLEFTQGHGAHAALPLPFKTPVKAKSPQRRSVRPELVRRFRLAEKDPVSLEKAPAGCQSALAGRRK